MSRVTPKRPFETTDGRTFETLEAAIQHADKIRGRGETAFPEYIWRRTGPGKSEAYYVLNPDGTQGFKGASMRRYGRVDVTRHYKRRRLISPKARRSFRVKRVGRHGNFITVCCPKGQWSPRRKRCKVGMRAQSIAKKRRRR